MFKLQVQEDEKDSEAWHDVKGPDGKLLVFEKESEARAKLEQLFPMLVKMERYAAGPKRTRVISMFSQEEE
jgi:hypothetical protein